TALPFEDLINAAPAPCARDSGATPRCLCGNPADPRSLHKRVPPYSAVPPRSFVLRANAPPLAGPVPPAPHGAGHVERFRWAHGIYPAPHRGAARTAAAAGDNPGNC